MKIKVKKFTVKLSAFLLLSLVLGTSTVSTALPSVTDNSITENPSDEILPTSDDPNDITFAPPC